LEGRESTPTVDCAHKLLAQACAFEPGEAALLVRMITRVMSVDLEPHHVKHRDDVVRDLVKVAKRALRTSPEHAALRDAIAALAKALPAGHRDRSAVLALCDAAPATDLVALHQARAGDVVKAIRDAFVAEKREHGARMYKHARRILAKQPQEIRASAVFIALTSKWDDTNTYLFDAAGPRITGFTREDVAYLLELREKKKPWWHEWDTYVSLVLEAEKRLAKARKA
jgi:hypothetical protein